MDVTQDFLNQIFAAKSKDLSYSYTDRKRNLIALFCESKPLKVSNILGFMLNCK